MSTVSEFRELPERYKRYVQVLTNLMKQHEITGVSSLVKCYRINGEFRSEWKSVWRDVASGEGGKVSLTTIGIIIGASLGGVGIAIGGGAFGLPLALLLGLGGLLGGSSFDSLGVFSKNKPLLIKIPKDLYDVIHVDAKLTNVKVSDIVTQKLMDAYKSET